MKIKQVMDGVEAPPANAQTTLDDVMKELETSTPAAPRR